MGDLFFTDPSAIPNYRYSDPGDHSISSDVQSYWRELTNAAMIELLLMFLIGLPIGYFIGVTVSW